MSNRNDFVVENGVLVKYTGSGGDVVIPNDIISIGFGAFSGRDDINSVIIPEGMTVISESAFSNCQNLKRVIIPEGVEKIDTLAFANCKSLQDLVLPESLRSIGGSAFAACSGLNSLVIPENVTRVAMLSFSYCNCDIYLPARNRDISNFNFSKCRVFIDMGEWKPEYTKALKAWNIASMIVDDVKTVPPLYRNAAILGFVQNADKYNAESAKQYDTYMKKNAAKLCPLAFDHPDVLNYLCEHELINPKDVDIFNSEAEKRADAELKALILDYQNKLGKDSVEKARAKKEKGKQEYEDAALERMMSHDLSKGISGITFAVTGKLKRWTSKDSLKEYLDQYGAALSSSITKKTDYLVTNDTDSGSEKNKKAKELGVAVISEEEFNEMIGSRFRDAEHIEIPTWMKEIQDTAFFECRSLREIIIPEGVKSIGFAAFSGCSSLKRIEIQDSVQNIKGQAFYGCNDLADSNGFIIVRNVLYQYCGSDQIATIPSYVTTIDSKAFSYNKNIVEVVIPDGAVKIAGGAFSGCQNLKKVIIPDSIVEIGWQAFADCISLAELSLPTNIKKIEFHVFSNCESLESVTIPCSAKEIDDSAFEGCTGLKDIYIPETVEKIGADRVFTGCRKLTIHTPEGSYAEQYAKAHKIKVVNE